MDKLCLLLVCITRVGFAHVEIASAEEALRDPRRTLFAQLLYSLHPQSATHDITSRRAVTRARSPIRMGFTRQSDYLQSKAKKAWFETIDQPTWQQAVDVISEAARSAVVTTELDVACNTGDDQACEDLSREEGAKQQWLARLDAPKWNAAAKAVSLANSVASSGERLSEDEAKKRWLAKLDKPALGKAAHVINEVAARVTEAGKLQDDCTAGNERACDVLSREQEAKNKWLAKLDAPSWQRVADTVSEVADTSNYLSSLVSGLAEEEAKRTWLAKQDKDKAQWGKNANRVSLTSEIASEASPTNHAPTGYLSGLVAGSAEEEAKRIWLAKQDKDAPKWGRIVNRESEMAPATSGTDAASIDYLSGLVTGSAEEEAKRIWLAKLDKDAPKWGRNVNTPEASATHYLEGLVAGSAEEEAKRIWLAKQDKDKPTWGRNVNRDPPTQYSEVAPEALAFNADPSNYLEGLVAGSAEEEAKRIWLAKQDRDSPRWGRNVNRESEMAAAASATDAAPTDYLSGLVSGSAEEEAKRMWLAKLDKDAPKWGRNNRESEMAAAASATYAAPTDYLSGLVTGSAEEEAKRLWLAKQDKDAPNWGRKANRAPPSLYSPASSERSESSPEAFAINADPTNYLEGLVAGSAEEEAKRLWLAKQDKIQAQMGRNFNRGRPSSDSRWTPRRSETAPEASAANADPAHYLDGLVSGSAEEEAKRKWLAEQDKNNQPEWGRNSNRAQPKLRWFQQ